VSLYLTYYLQFVAVFILLTWALYIPFRAGLLYNGCVYCMAIGGYFAAFAMRDLGWPFGLALLAAMVVGGLLGFLPALGFTRTKGIATAIGSIALIFIIQSVLRNLEFLGGVRGFHDIPRVDYLLLITYLFVLLIGFFIYRLDHSRLGRAMEAMCVDSELAATMGVDIRKIGVLLLTISSVIGALAGVIFAVAVRTIYPNTFDFTLLLYIWTMLFIGGRYTMWGTLIAVPILWGLPQWLPSAITEYTKIAYGALLVIVIIMRPEGIVNRHLLNRLAIGRKVVNQHFFRKGPRR
jgi:branched-chain amino acid transport system permease protein